MWGGGGEGEADKRPIVELAILSSVSLLEYSHQTATWSWALWNNVMVKGGVPMDKPTLVQSDVIWPGPLQAWV